MSDAVHVAPSGCPVCLAGLSSAKSRAALRSAMWKQQQAAIAECNALNTNCAVQRTCSAAHLQAAPARSLPPPIQWWGERGATHQGGPTGKAQPISGWQLPTALGWPRLAKPPWRSASNRLQTPQL